MERPAVCPVMGSDLTRSQGSKLRASKPGKPGFGNSQE